MSLAIAPFDSIIPFLEELNTSSNIENHIISLLQDSNVAEVVVHNEELFAGRIVPLDNKREKYVIGEIIPNDFKIRKEKVEGVQLSDKEQKELEKRVLDVLYLNSKKYNFRDVNFYYREKYLFIEKSK